MRKRRYELFDRSDLKDRDERGMTWENCYAAVSEALRDTDAAGSKETIKASYQYVNRKIEDGHDKEFLTVARHIDPTERSSGSCD